MNLMHSNQQQTMTSREMADLTEKRHDNVRRTIESLFHEGLISKPQIEDGNKAANGVVERVYHVCKRDSYVIVAQLSPAFTARLVDRWQELEVGAAPSRALSLAEMFLQNAQALVAMEQTQATQAAQIATQADAIKRIEANQVAAVASVQSFTALGFSIYKQIQMSAIELNKLGRKASSISKKRGLTIDQVADGRHGRVGSYHVSVLEEALQELMK